MNQARFGERYRQRIVSPSAIIARLYRGFVDGSSDYVKERLAQGMWRKSMLEGLMKLMETQKAAHVIDTALTPEQPDADSGVLAATSEQPADRAEAVHGA
jgi:hypothetical protein